MLPALHSLLPFLTIFLTHSSHYSTLLVKVLDLLNPSPRCLNVRWAKDRGFYAENLFKVECEDIGDLEGVLEEGKSFLSLLAWSAFSKRLQMSL